jgi:predicted PurR-regulated permease PerM
MSLAIKLVAVAAVVWIWFQIWQVILALIVSIMIAVALQPVVVRLERRRVARWLAAAMPVFAIVLAIGGFLYATWSSLLHQADILGPQLSRLPEQIRRSVPFLDRIIGGENGLLDPFRLQGYGLSLAQSAVQAILFIAIGAILTIYLLIEREQVTEWVISFVPRRTRPKMRRTAHEAREVVFGYVAANVATSIFAGIFVLVSLKLLKIPAALLLALLAAVFDFVPVLGFILAGVPAVALATTKSGSHALAVVVLYISYHFIENYFIAPKIYGDRLRLSNTAVLVAFAVGAELGGVIGALLALPIAGTYPTIERLWLKERLGADVVEDHQRLQQEKESA